MQIILIASPQEEETTCGYPIAHAAYHIEGSSLLRQNALHADGGLLHLRDHGTGIEDAQAVCDAVLRECGRRGYRGAVLDVPTGRNVRRLARLLDGALAEKKLDFYVPETLAEDTAHAAVLIETALSGGVLSERLREAAEKYQNRLALDVERVRMDFPLPAYSGMGTPLTAAELEELRKNASVFYSADLCARYFTYKRNGETRFVLFDDAETLRRKVQMGREAGAKAAFFVWSEVADLAAGQTKRQPD